MNQAFHLHNYKEHPLHFSFNLYILLNFLLLSHYSSSPVMLISYPFISMGQELEVQGSIRLKFSILYRSQKENLPLLVVTGSGPSHDWLQKIHLNWRAIHHLWTPQAPQQTSLPADINCLTDGDIADLTNHCKPTTSTLTETLSSQESVH